MASLRQPHTTRKLRQDESQGLYYKDNRSDAMSPTVSLKGPYDDRQPQDLSDATQRPAVYIAPSKSRYLQAEHHALVGGLSDSHALVALPATLFPSLDRRTRLDCDR